MEGGFLPPPKSSPRHTRCSLDNPRSGVRSNSQLSHNLFVAEKISVTIRTTVRDSSANGGCSPCHTLPPQSFLSSISTLQSANHWNCWSAPPVGGRRHLPLRNNSSPVRDPLFLPVSSST